VYLRGRAGLVTEASASLGRGASPEETLACDLAYVVSRSARRDLGILATAMAS
jgi:lipopolysaccharide/colanic/teichoic acid biosynthesis glycosyltransferase